MRHYVALVHKDADSAFGVSFPDFPGCASAGATLAEAAEQAVEALAGHVELMIDEGLAIPEPSSFDEIMADPEYRDGVAVLVKAPAPRAARAIRVNVTVPEDVLAEIDRYAEARGFTRSGFLVQSAKKAMESA